MCGSARTTLRRCALVLALAALSANLVPPPFELSSVVQASDGIAPGPASRADTEDEAKPEGQKEALKPWSMSMAALAGLVLFIFGMSQLAQGLTELNSERMRRVVSRFTTNRLAGVATGAAATTLLESSSVVIIMLIAMVSGGLLSMPQALGVVLGANIGTTLGAQIIAFDLAEYVPILMLAGILLMFIGKSQTRHRLGLVLLGFGLLYYGLEAIDQAMKPLRDHGPFLAWMQGLGDNALLGAAVGCVFTLVIQSSSATVAVVITLAGSGLISLPAGVAVMLGAEIGTCSDTLIATIGRGRPALRTGVFHLAFNLVSACLGVGFAPQLVELVQALPFGASVGRQIANAQILFNLIGVLCVLPFLSGIAQLLERLIPEPRAHAERPAAAIARHNPQRS
jgi:phosphate:Na+ symporter